VNLQVENNPAAPAEGNTAS